jgi:Zn-finger nucleic acid-binding protein
MDARTLKDAVVDVCPGCKGLWLDWFDGEPSHVASEAAPLSVPQGPTPAVLDARCPECRCPLALEHYRESLALWRCGACAGTFVPRVSFEALAELRPHVEAHRSALHRLIAVIAHILDAALP